MTTLPYRTDGALDQLLKRDLMVLNTLAHVTWLTTDQLHLLCFPGYTLATVRTTLRYFEAAGWLRRARWRSKGCLKSHVWAITTKGRTIVARYTPMHIAPQFLDLARPSTALEHEEHRVQVAVRSLVARLILEARSKACLAHLTVTRGAGERADIGVASAPIAPDALLSVAWVPPRRQAATWLPWLDGAPQAEQIVRYPLYVDRAIHPDQRAAMLAEWNAPSAPHPCLPLLIFDQEARLHAVQHTLQAHAPHRFVRMTTWMRLEAGITGSAWQDVAGRVCALRPPSDAKREEAA